jgi:glycosyltransferase involved in cell wall biosynthesis
LVFDSTWEKAMKKILYIHHGGELGGAPLSLLFLLEQLNRDRYDPVLLFLADGDAVDAFRSNGYDCHIATDIDDFSQTELVWYGNSLLWQLPGKILSFSPSIKATHNYLRHFQPDLVHLNSSTLAAPAQACYEAGVPVVWHIREPLAQGYFGFRRKLLRRRISRHASRVISISHYDASLLFPSDRIRVIHNFVNFSVYDRNIDVNTARIHYGIESGKNVVTMLGGCSKPKGTLQFVRALPIVLDKKPDTCFLIAGPKPLIMSKTSSDRLLRRLLLIDEYEHKVMQAATEFISAGHLRFLGVRRDVPQLIAATDIIVFPSTVPHFARPVIEASAMAKPVIASDIGGPRELVVPDETGLLIPPDNPEKLATAIVSLLDDPEMMTQMGEKGYQRATNKFDSKVNSERTYAVYDELLLT